MKKKGAYIYIFLLLIGLALACPITAAPHQATYSSDTITYNTKFKGIGPKVYNLPSPQSKQEILSKEYEKKQSEAPSIDSLLDRQQFYRELTEIGYMPVGPVAPTKTQQDLQRIINGHLYAGNIADAAGAQNSLAILLVQTAQWSRAESLFREALTIKLTVKDQVSALVISQNLALLEQHLGQSGLASSYFEQAINLSEKLKNKRAQANALVGLSIENARMHRYDEAERTIIRKAVPLFKSAHDVDGHISAFKSLAQVYEMQQKYAQASWFYLQAKKLALPGMENSGEMAYIFYNLAHIKYLTGDATLAVLDYKSAENIARKHNLISLQLHIQDALGEIYHQAGDYTSAVLAINEYNNLKNKILKSQVDMRTGI